MAGLDLQLYNDPVLLWDKILEELNEETLLILPSQLARNQFLQRQGDKAIWSGNILTVLDIRKKIKDIMDSESQILLNAEALTSQRQKGHHRAESCLSQFVWLPLLQSYHLDTP